MNIIKQKTIFNLPLHLTPYQPVLIWVTSQGFQLDIKDVF